MRRDHRPIGIIQGIELRKPIWRRAAHSNQWCWDVVGIGQCQQSGGIATTSTLSADASFADMMPPTANRSAARANAEARLLGKSSRFRSSRTSTDTFIGSSPEFCESVNKNTNFGGADTDRRLSVRRYRSLIGGAIARKRTIVIHCGVGIRSNVETVWDNSHEGDVQCSMVFRALVSSEFQEVSPGRQCEMSWSS